MYMGDKLSKSDLQKIAHNAIIKLDSGDVEGALDITYSLKEFFPNANAVFFCSGNLIDIGCTTNNREVITDGISILKEISYKGLKSEKYYFLGNAYSGIHAINNSENPNYYFLNDSNELLLAKKYFIKALHYIDDDLKFFNEKILKSRILVNIANTYDDLGRSMDALEYYEESFNYDQNNPIAWGNKGIALYRYAKLMGHYKTTIYFDAHELLEKAISLGPYPKALRNFELTKKKIDEKLKNKKKFDRPELQIESDADLDLYNKTFCYDNKLYLNLCNYCQRCGYSIKDAVLPNIESNESFSNLATYFNQIKIDFITARTLLFLSGYDKLDLSTLYKNLELFSLDDNSNNDVDVQLLKSSFKSFADTLDKIGHFLNEYLSLGMGKKDVTYAKVLNKIQLTNRSDIKKNPGLNALFDIYLDFKKGEYNELAELRNKLTHQFISVKNNDIKGDSKIIRKQDLKNKTIKLAHIVKNSIIYLFYFVNLQKRIIDN